jgi:hypothetical protein
MSAHMSIETRSRDCPECGCAGSLRLDVCQVCYAEVGERDRTLFWDLRFDEYLFETDSFQSA